MACCPTVLHSKISFDPFVGIIALGADGTTFFTNNFSNEMQQWRISDLSFVKNIYTDAADLSTYERGGASDDHVFMVANDNVIRRATIATDSITTLFSAGPSESLYSMLFCHLDGRLYLSHVDYNIDISETRAYELDGSYEVIYNNTSGYWDFDSEPSFTMDGSVWYAGLNYAAGDYAFLRYDIATATSEVIPYTHLLPEQPWYGSSVGRLQSNGQSVGVVFSHYYETDPPPFQSRFITVAPDGALFVDTATDPLVAVDGDGWYYTTNFGGAVCEAMVTGGRFPEGGTLLNGAFAGRQDASGRSIFTTGFGSWGDLREWAPCAILSTRTIFTVY